MSSEQCDSSVKVRRFIAWYTYAHGAEPLEDHEILTHLESECLGTFPSSRALYSRMASNGFPVCPICGKTPVKKEHERTHQKPPRSQTDTPKPGSSRRELPAASDASGEFRAALSWIEHWYLNTLEAEVSCLEGEVREGKFLGKRFITDVQDTEYREVYREKYSADEWEELCKERDVDPSATERIEILVPVVAPGGVSTAPTGALVVLIAVSALTPRWSLEEVTKKLHRDLSEVDWDQIKDKQDKLMKAARHLAQLVRGGVVGRGNNPAVLDEDGVPGRNRIGIQQYLAWEVSSLHEQGMSDDEIAKKIKRKYFRPMLDEDDNFLQEDSRSKRINAAFIKRLRAFNLNPLE